MTLITNPMENAKILIYDGSFNGFLTAIFVAFEGNFKVTDIQSNTENQNGLFSETETIFTEMGKAKSVWSGIQNKSQSAIKNVYFGFLSESAGIEFVLYRYIRRLFDKDASLVFDYSGDGLERVDQVAKSVGREKSRMEAYIHFQKTKDNIHFAFITPDNDILPLISKYFRSRYSNREWIIYDVKRKYGLHYDLSGVELISLDSDKIYANGITKSELNSGYDTQVVWNNYFRRSYIKPHISSKLRSAQIPKRQWKYENERTAV